MALFSSPLRPLLSLAFALQAVQAAPQHWQPAANALISSPLGGAEVYNACPFSVNSNIVHAPRPGAEGPPEEIWSTLATGQNASHPFLHDPGMGISWKLSLTTGAAAPVQFEWTWVPDQHRSYWDLSMIDAGVGKRSLLRRQEQEQEWEGEQEMPPAASTPAPPSNGGIAHPFAQYGMTVQPMSGGQAVNGEGMCSMVTCKAGEAACVAAYNYPEDWSRQHDCPEGVSLRLALCG